MSVSFIHFSHVIGWKPTDHFNNENRPRVEKRKRSFLKF